MKMQRTEVVAMVLVAVCAIMTSDVRANDWPQWRFDAARSAASPDELPANLPLQWTRQLPAPRPAWPASQPSLRFDASYEPVAAEGRLFVPSMVTDSVTAYDTETGEEIWRFFTDGPVRLAPCYGEGKLYFGSDDGYLYCIEAADGKLAWKFCGGPSERNILANERLASTWPVRGGPVLHGGVVYFSAGIWPFMGIFVHAVDAERGTSVWLNSGDSITYQTNPHDSPAFGGFVPRGHLAISDDGLLAPGGRTPPGTYDLNTGELVKFDFAKKGGRSEHGPITIKAGSQTFTAAEGRVETNGWQHPLDGEAWTLLAAEGKLFVVTTDGRIHCFGAGEGETVDHPAPEPPPETAPNKWDTLAGAILRRTGVTEGYALVLGLGSGGLAEALMRASDLHLIVVDPDAAKVDAFRQAMVRAGWYGTRVSAHVGDPIAYSLPPYFASLIVSEDARAAGASGAAFASAAFRCLRPYGGVACLPIEADRFEDSTREAKLAGAAVESLSDHWSILRRQGALPGAADWTHQYADAANSLVSKDTLVKAPLGILWFGGPSNDDVLPRHGHGPSPQVAAGRLLIEGPDMLRAIDIYTGRLLWQRQLPGLGEFYDNTDHQPGASEIGSNYVTLEDAAYVVYGDKILRLDPRTGETESEIKWEAADDGAGSNWGSIRAYEDLLIATATPARVSDVPLGDKAEDAKPSGPDFVPVRYSSASRRLVVMDRTNGRVLWQRPAEYGFRHNNIAVAAGKVFCIDGLSPLKLAAMKRRGLGTEDYHPELLALDVRNGDAVWSTKENVFATFLSYSTEHDVLLQAGSNARDRALDEVGRGMVAYRGADGQVLWQDLERAHAGPCMLHQDTIITQDRAYSLLTGEPHMRRDPLTGRETEWRFTRNYGCNTAIAGQNLITFRSAAAGFYDLAGDGGTGNLGGFKSSCTSNLIMAGGLLNAPEYTRTCTCNYQNQTSLALVHDPEVETWTFNAFEWDGSPVKRAGVNFGAPGDRRDARGVLWLDYPSVGGPSPDLPVTVSPDSATYHRQHASLVEAGEGAIAWVAASGVVGAREIHIGLGRREDARPRKYRVRLHFAELLQAAPGERLFDVFVQDRKVIERLDVVATGKATVRVCEVSDVEVTDELRIRLVPCDETPDAEPILCGVEVAIQE